MASFEVVFRLGMDRYQEPFLDLPPGLQFDLGASGKKVAPGAIGLGLPNWYFPKDTIPSGNETVAAVHAYHFLEHLAGEHAIQLLAEVQRVLMPGGVFQFCIPFYNSSMASQDLTHKSFWTETTFKTLFDNSYYDPTFGEVEWLLKVHCLWIVGIVERNICLLGQLVKS